LLELVLGDRGQIRVLLNEPLEVLLVEKPKLVVPLQVDQEAADVLLL
jgi:hypothetical protein